MEDQVNGSAEAPKPHIDRYNEAADLYAKAKAELYKRRKINGAPLVDIPTIGIEVSLLEATVSALVSAMSQGIPELEERLFNTMAQNTLEMREQLLA